MLDLRGGPRAPWRGVVVGGKEAGQHGLELVSRCVWDPGRNRQRDSVTRPGGLLGNHSGGSEEQGVVAAGL